MRLGLEAGEHTHALAVELGIQGVPISAEKLTNEGVEALLKPLREHGLSVCQIGAFGFNPLSTDSEAQARQTVILTRAIPLARDTGCSYIVINGGNYHPSGFGGSDARNFTRQALEKVADALKPLLESAEKHGVYLSIEAYLKTAVNSPESFLKLKEMVGASDALRVNIDVTSLYTYEDVWNPEPKVAHICQTLVGHYGLVHLKGVALKEGFHIHIALAPITEDRTDWSQVLRFVSPHLPEDSWCILEHVLTPEEARASMVHLHQAAKNADVMLT